MRPANTKESAKAYIKAHGVASTLEVAEAIGIDPDWVQQTLGNMVKEGILELASLPENRVRYGRKYRLKQQSVPFTSLLQFAKAPGLRDSVVAHTSPFPPGVPVALTEAGCSVWAIKKHWEQYYALQE